MFDQLPSASPIDIFQDAMYRWRGIAKWPDAEATVFSCEWIPDLENGGGWYQVVFTYVVSDDRVRGQFRSFSDETSSPYLRGDTFTLRYNPKHPASFYYANERSTFEDYTVLIVFLVIGAVATFISISLFR